MANGGRMPPSPSSSDLGGFGENFERARNIGGQPGGLGDSERWGSEDIMVVRVPAGANPIQVRARSQQLVRVQLENLSARRWCGTFGWTLLAPPPSTASYVVIMGLAMQWGVGQHSQRGFYQTFEDAGGTIFFPSQPSGSASSPQASQSVPVGPSFAVSAQEGIVVLPELPATTMAIFASLLFIDNAARNAAYEVRYQVSAAVAPRAL